MVTKWFRLNFQAIVSIKNEICENTLNNTIVVVSIKVY